VSVLDKKHKDKKSTLGGTDFEVRNKISEILETNRRKRGFDKLVLNGTL